MFIKTLLVFLITLSPLLAASIKGEGQFFAQDEDSLAFVKRQLLASAFKDVVMKEMKNMGLDHKLFKEKYEERFDDYFRPIADELKKKYFGDPQNKEKKQVTPAKRLEFQRKLRIKRLGLKRNFGRIDRAIMSYIIKKMSRSTKYKNSRYIRVMAKVDRKTVNAIYLNFTRKGEVRSFDTLYINVKYELKNITWKDLGVSVASDFTSVVEGHWLKWLQGQLGGFVSEVKIADPATLSQVYTALSMPEETLQSMEYIGETEQSGESKEEDSKEEEMVSGKVEVPPSISNFRNSLLVNLKLFLTGMGKNDLFKKVKIKYESSVNFVDLKNGKIIDYHDFPAEIHRYDSSAPHQLSSNIASFVYRMPLGHFMGVKKKLGYLSSSVKSLKVNVSQVGSVEDIILLNQVLMEKGVTLQVNSLLDYYSKGKSKIKIEYNGTKEDLVQFLSSLDQFVLSNQKKITFLNKEKPFDFILTKNGGMVENGQTNGKDENVN